MNPSSQLPKLRKYVESVDCEIIKLIRERFIFTNQIQNLKRLLELPLQSKKREAELLKKYRNLAKRYKLPEGLIKKLFKSIFYYSKKSGIMKRT